MNATVSIILGRKDQNGKQLEKRKLKIQVSFHRKTRAYSANTRLLLTEAEFKNNRLAIHKEAFEEAQRAFLTAQHVVKQLGEDFTFDEFKRLYDMMLLGDYKTTQELGVVLQRYAADQNRAHPISEGSIVNYRTAINAVSEFKKGVKISDITPAFINKFENYLRKTNPSISPNTIKSYLRTIKTLYNYAVEKQWIIDKKPFAGKSLQSARKLNFGLSRELYQAVVDFSSFDPLAQMGRDFFVLSFELNGNYLSDILLLKNKNIVNTPQGLLLTFVRKKTRTANRAIPMLITPTARELLNKYGRIDLSSPEGYILPYLSRTATEKQMDNLFHDVGKKINKGLKIVAEAIGVPSLTLAQARHTYASVANECGRNLTAIQSDLGHTDAKTTQGYLNSISTQQLEEAMDIKSMFFKKKR